MATKYPIILAHGIFMKPRFFRVFKHISKKLKEAERELEGPVYKVARKVASWFVRF